PPTPGAEHPSAVEPAEAVSLPVPFRGLAGKNGSRPAEPAELAAADIPMEEKFDDVRGMRLCVCAWGPPEGRPVLCLHGMLDHGASWERVGAALARRGLRV